MEQVNIGTKLKQILGNFEHTTTGILGSAIVSIDGFSIASTMPQAVEERKLGAMAAAMLGLGEQTVEEFTHGEFSRVFVEGERGYTIITSTGPDAMLAVIAQKKAKLGMVFLQVNRAAVEVAKVLERQPAGIL